VKKGIVVAIVLMLSAPVTTLGQASSPDAQKRRNQIKLLEGVLQNAAGLGAEHVAKKLQVLDPGVTVLVGQPRARGFVLETYGIFFDVEVPALIQSVVWSQMILQRDAQIGTALESLRRALESMPAGPDRSQAQQAFRRLEMQVGPLPQRGGRAVSAANAAATDVATTPPGSPATPLNASAPVEIPANWDPLAEYTTAVQNQLIEAMLDYSQGLNLGPDEWLTVAARDSHGPVMPGQIDDAQTIVLRVKGSDLAAYAADRTRREEIRRKVEVRVF
jgi:hypothetical protein